MATKAPAKKKTDYAADMKAAQKRGDKKAYYTAQRKRAEKTGDKKTLSSIAEKRMSPGQRDAKRTGQNVGRALSSTGLNRAPSIIASRKDDKPVKMGGGIGSAVSGAMKQLGGGSGFLGMQTTAETKAAMAKQTAAKKKMTAKSGSNGKSKKAAS